MTYRDRKNEAKTFNRKPTKADQSQADQTDINVIMRQFRVTGMVPGGRSGATFVDWTQARDLRGMLELARNLRKNHASLPEQFRTMSTPELLALTDQQIADKLRTVEPPKEPPTT